ncbi:WXG100 family type VII secretion target [Saccharopolyspora sp. MS10]|uniref:WXG100 family type VII secretion target n=1 Tax=Saccharopolyspora sp. MS10 TaxID=3385973 RepID=UPI0039A3018D
MTDVLVDVDGQAVESGAHTAGAGIVDSARATWSAFNNEDWGEFAASGGVLALDALITAIDPVGSALAAGVGWLMEHLAPLREALDFLAGDPNAIKAGADTWQEVKAELEKLAGEIPGQVQAHTAEWQGKACDAYVQRSAELAEGVEAMSVSAGTASAAIATAGTMVATCRGLIRDIVAAVVAELIKGALAALAGSVVSFGATVAGYLGYAAGRVGMTLSKIATKVSELLGKLGKAGTHLAKALDDMAEASAKVGAKLTTGGAQVFPTSPGLGGAATAAGQATSRASDALGSTASAVGRGGDALGSAGARTADAATGLGKGADQLGGRGLGLVDDAGDLGQAAQRGTQRGVDAATLWREGGGIDGAAARETAETISDVRTAESQAARGAVGAQQYHEQNYAEGDYYDTSHRLAGTIPSAEEHFPK